jgi:hypothetical protein
MPLAARPRCLTCGRVSTVVLPALVLDALQGCFAPTGGGREKPEEAPAVRFRCEFGAESASCAEDEDNASSVSSFAKSSSHFSVVSWEERCRTCACGSWWWSWLMLSRLGKSSRMKSESQKSLMKLDLTRLHADSDLEVARSRLESTKSSFFFFQIQIFITTVL